MESITIQKANTFLPYREAKSPDQDSKKQDQHREETDQSGKNKDLQSRNNTESKEQTVKDSKADDQEK